MISYLGKVKKKDDGGKEDGKKGWERRKPIAIVAHTEIK